MDSISRRGPKPQLPADLRPLEPHEKYCPKCETIKPKTDFYKHPATRDGHMYICKKCDGARVSQRVKLKGSFDLYGMTREEYETMLQKQNGKCAICGHEERNTDKNGNIKRLSIDHCHLTGKLRGLLCQQCNTALGMLGENAERVKALLKYIEERCKIEEYEL